MKSGKNNKIYNEKFIALSQTAVDEITESKGANLKGDYKNVGLLLVMYLLQGVPQGISQAIPILLQNRGVSYSEQAKFSVAFFPLAFKLLWAPFIDSVFIKSFGRRKTWICSAQVVIGIFMIYLSKNADRWLGDRDDSQPQVGILTAVFALLILFTTVQDVAVDGWGLTLLQRRNIGYAATTNSVGLAAGRFIGYTILLVFESKEFCNSYLFSVPKETGLFTLSDFIMFWAGSYLLVTILIALFKYECPENAAQLKEHSDYGVCKAYRTVLRIIKLRPVIELCAMVFTIEACFASFLAVSSLKLVEYGVPKEKVALISLPSAPVQILTPLFITKYTAGRKPLSFYSKMFICRIINIIVTTIFVFTTPMMLEKENLVAQFYTGAVLLFMIDQGMTRATYSADGSFFAKVADPLVGGSYMTLLNTFGNFGTRFFSTVSLWLLDRITWKTCDLKKIEGDSMVTFSVSNNTCLSDSEKLDCNQMGGSCVTQIDGFYIEVAISMVYAIIWYKVFTAVIYRLQRYSDNDWYVLTNRKNTKNVEMS